MDLPTVQTPAASMLSSLALKDKAVQQNTLMVIKQSITFDFRHAVSLQPTMPLCTAEMPGRDVACTVPVAKMDGTSLKKGQFA